MGRGKALGLCTACDRLVYTDESSDPNQNKMISFRSEPSWSLTPELLKIITIF